MTDLIPTKEQYNQWKSDWSAIRVDKRGDIGHYLVIRAAQWGADQELEACREWLSFHHYPGLAQRLRTARRPKTPRLKEIKERALEAAARFYAKGHEDCTEQEVRDDYDTLCRALEQLND
jgi:hypothetical protein